ncbi:hypothetical protein Emag_006149 [Eimeria magna]
MVLLGAASPLAALRPRLQQQLLEEGMKACVRKRFLFVDSFLTSGGARDRSRALPVCLPAVPIGTSDDVSRPVANAVAKERPLGEAVVFKPFGTGAKRPLDNHRRPEERWPPSSTNGSSSCSTDRESTATVDTDCALMGGATSSRGSRPNGDGTHQQQRQRQQQQQQQPHRQQQRQQQQEQEQQELQYQQQQEEHQRRYYQQQEQLQEQRQYQRQRQHLQQRQQRQQDARQRQTGVIEPREWDGFLTLAPGASSKQPPWSTSRSRGMGEEPPVGLFFSSAPPRMNNVPRLFVPDEFAGLEFSYEELFEAFLLLDLNAAQAEHSAHAALRYLQKLQSSVNRDSSINNNSSTEATEVSRDEGEEALLRFATGRRKVQRMQQLLTVAEQTNELPIETQEDWEGLAGCFFGSLYCISRTFWKSQGASSVTSSGGSASSSSSSSSGNSSSSSGSSSYQEGGNGFPVDLDSASRFYSRLVDAARKVEGRIEATSVLLKSIEAFCVLLMTRAKALQYPHQLAFVPILLECPFLEDDVKLGALARLCELVASLPFTSRCILVNWRACTPSLLLLLLVPWTLFLGSQCFRGCCSCIRCLECVLRLRLVGWLSAAVRLLTAAPLGSWRSPRATSPFSEAALRSALELLHLLYTANVRRQQQRLLLKNWRHQDVAISAEEAFEGDDISFAAAQQQKQQKQQQREIEFEAFHNDAINSSQELLQFEFALWIRVRRAGPLNSSAEQDILRRRGMPAIQPVVTEHFPPQQRDQQQQELEANESPAAGDAQQAGGGEGRPAGARQAADAAEGRARDIQDQRGSGERSVSADSLFSPQAEADAALQGLSDSDEGAEVVFLPEAGQAESAEERASSGLLFGSDSLQSHLMRVLETVREPRDAGSAAASADPSTTVRQTAAAAAAALPDFSGGSGAERPASTAAAAAALAANMPFNHSAVPGAGGRGHRTLFTLLAHPFVLDASSKAEILRREAAVEQQMQARQSEVEALFSLCTGGVGYPLPFLYLRVRRSHLLQDTLQQIASNSSTGGRSRNANLRKALKVKFVGEEGVDQGGVAKEFFQLLVDEATLLLLLPHHLAFMVLVSLLLCLSLLLYSCCCCKRLDLRVLALFVLMTSPRVVVSRLDFPRGLLLRGACISCMEGRKFFLFSPDYGMFTLDEESQMQWFCGFSLESRFRFELIGILCGLAIHNSILMPALLALPRPEPRSLLCVLKASDEALEAMRLTFSVSSDFLGEQRETALGSHDPTEKVTVQKREEFVELYIQHVLNTSVEAQYSAFEGGFYRCVDRAAVSLFRPEELQLLLLGKEEELDVALLQKAAAYDDGYTADSPAIVMFWRVCSRLNQEQKKCLLMFVTGSDRVPLGGAQGLRLTIARSGPDSDRSLWDGLCITRRQHQQLSAGRVIAAEAAPSAA